MKVAQSKELNPIGWGSGASFLDQSQSEKGPENTWTSPDCFSHSVMIAIMEYK